MAADTMRFIVLLTCWQRQAAKNRQRLQQRPRGQRVTQVTESLVSLSGIALSSAAALLVASSNLLNRPNRQNVHCGAL
eukprot:13220734-Alexandrium_andersonii.AAC.1